MATLAVKVVGHGGLNLANGDYANAGASGDQAVTGSGVALLVKNGDTASKVVTLAVPGTVDGLAVSSRTVTIPAGDMGIIPLLDLYRNPVTGLASWTYSAETSVTVVVIRVA